jgi:hypothetical protein
VILKLVIDLMNHNLQKKNTEGYVCVDGGNVGIKASARTHIHTHTTSTVCHLIGSLRENRCLHEREREREYTDCHVSCVAAQPGAHVLLLV